jgi:hypothetical protein
VKRFTPVQIALGIVGLGLGVAAVLVLREATLSTHGEPVGREVELVVSAKTKGGEPTQTLPNMVEAQLLACRLEVNSQIVGPIEDLGSGRFRAVLAPSMDQTNRRQFRGCVEDWMIDHVLINVVELNEIE